MEELAAGLRKVRKAVRGARHLLAKPDGTALWQSREQLEAALTELSGLERRLRAGERAVGERGVAAGEFLELAAELRIVGALLRQVGQQFEGWEPAPVTRDILVA